MLTFIFLVYLCAVVMSSVAVDPNNKCNFQYSYKSGAVKTIVSPNKCYCGPNQVTLTYLSDQYCCIPPEDECTYDETKAFCPSGKVVRKSELCNGQCYHEYALHEKNLSRGTEWKILTAYYSCDGVCLPASEMCQGIYCGNQENICKKENVKGCLNNYGRSLRSLNETLIISEHNYCNIPNKRNNGKYDIIDRSDEKSLKFVQEDIDFSKLKQCIDAFGRPGVQCDNMCLSEILWCTGDEVSLISDIKCLLGDKEINLNDAKLCGDTTIWNNFTCDIDLSRMNAHYIGSRCSGRFQHCYYTWYNAMNGIVKDATMKGSCKDKSDQVFYTQTLCNTTHFLETHTQNWCTDDRMKNQEICTDPSSWLQNQPGLEYQDPHNCWNSCSEPGPNCQACTNENYFQCTKSGKCIHPDLECDGHPQCDEAEDEDLDKCRELYVSRNIIKPYASFPCFSKMYTGKK